MRSEGQEFLNLNLTRILPLSGILLKSSQTLFLKFLLVSSFISLGAYSPIPPHAFYVSIHEITYDASWGNLDLEVKIFSNDLEDALQKKSKDPLFLRRDKESPLVDRYLYAYLNEHIQLRKGDDSFPLFFAKRRFVEDATWIHLKAYSLCDMEELTVKSSILLELFDAQTNIIRLKAYGEKWIANLDRQIREEKFLLK